MTSPIAVYFMASVGADTSALITPIFTPSDGELITVCSTSWDTNNPTGAPSGGGQAFLTKDVAAPGGFNGYARVDGCIVADNPGPMQVTVAGTANPSRHCACVIRWPAGTSFGAVGVPHNGAGLPALALSTTGPASIIVWCSVDVNSRDPATAVYRADDGTDDFPVAQAGLGDFHAGSNSVQYYAYAQVGAQSPPAYTIGMDAPAAQQWVLAAVEVLDLIPVTTAGPSIEIEQGPPLWTVTQSTDAIEQAGQGSLPSWSITQQ